MCYALWELLFRIQNIIWGGGISKKFEKRFGWISR